MFKLKRAFMASLISVSTLMSSVIASEPVYSKTIEDYNIRAGVHNTLGDMVYTNTYTPKVTAGVVDVLSNLPEESETVENEEKESDLKLIKFDTPKKYYISSEIGLNVRSAPSADSSIVNALPYNYEVVVSGKVEGTDFYYIQLKADVMYISSKYLSKEKLPELPKKQTISSNWSGDKLNRSNGTITGPSGKETYYNLPMQGVINIMRSIGNNDIYWVRSDGVKMLGNYVMVAADLSIRPRGSHVPTSLGMGVVCDTGTFIYSNRTQLDIAVSWS